VMNGVSKAYSMTGWRIGYAGGPQKLIAAMKKVQSQSTSNPASISQAAAEAALAGDQQCVKDMVKAFKERHDYVVDALNKLPGVTCAAGDGTFYAFPDFSGAIAAMDGVESCTDLAAKLLETAEVALVPGSAFGAPGCLRLSFATGMDTLKEAIRRIEQALNK
ncbi:MAG: aspartate aminotransferase, partial [Alcanivorax sp.]|nr:aspartate aminotransferase [Alcanivorax sp.]